MQEDIEATMRSLHGGRANAGTEDVVCLCGYAYPAWLLALRAGDEAEGVRSEYEYVCPKCGALLLSSQEPGFPLEEEE